MLRGHRSDFGKCVAHCGLGIIIFGISAITAWETEDIRIVSPGEKFNLGQYEFQFLGVRQYRNQNFMTTQGEFRVDKGGKFIDSLLPEKRFYPVAGIWTTEAAIDKVFFGIFT